MAGAPIVVQMGQASSLLRLTLGFTSPNQWKMTLVIAISRNASVQFTSQSCYIWITKNSEIQIYFITHTPTYQQVHIMLMDYHFCRWTSINWLAPWFSLHFISRLCIFLGELYKLYIFSQMQSLQSSLDDTSVLFNLHHHTTFHSINIILMFNVSKSS